MAILMGRLSLIELALMPDANLLDERGKRVRYCEIGSYLTIGKKTSPCVEGTLHAVEATTQEV
jgi:hypothetical protein